MSLSATKKPVQQLMPTTIVASGNLNGHNLRTGSSEAAFPQQGLAQDTFELSTRRNQPVKSATMFQTDSPTLLEKAKHLLGLVKQ